MKWLHKAWQAGRGGVDVFVEPVQRLVQAGLEVDDTPAEKIALLTRYVELTKSVEDLAQARVEAGQATPADLHQARYRRLSAEIQLLRAEREADRAKGK
jgi:hypothetical protein